LAVSPVNRFTKEVSSWFTFTSMMTPQNIQSCFAIIYSISHDKSIMKKLNQFREGYLILGCINSLIHRRLKLGSGSIFRRFDIPKVR